MLEQPREPAPPEASPELLARIGSEIAAAGGALPFDRFMAMALYEPGLGYYSRPERTRVGTGGDFVTSVSVGRCFGMLLARHLAPALEAMAERHAGELGVVEPGAEGGDLAADLMAELAALLPASAGARLRYVAIEPTEDKRAALRARLEGFGFPHTVVAGAGELRAARGVLVANEVLDAMPVKRLRWRDGAWHECCVGLDTQGNLHDVLCEAGGASLANFTKSLPTGLEDGFTVEFNPALDAWFAELGASFEVLHACIIDYGLAETRGFFDPGRRDGTLRAYRGQRPIDDPLSAPGETDLTAHVDFEHARRAAEAAGLQVLALTDQHRFLVAAARPWLLEIESRGAAPDPATAKLLRQFQSLSHPAAMGMAFQVLELGKGL